MDLQNVKDLIAMRDYIISYVSSPKAETRIVNYLNNCLSMIDKKIISYLSSEEFKKFINYEGYDEDRRFNLAKLNKVV